MSQPFLTILFAELTAAAAGVRGSAGDGPAATRRAHIALLRQAVVEGHGREVRPTESGLVAAFPSAVAAVRCAVAMQRRTIAAAGVPVLRAALDAGEPHHDGENLHGAPVTIAARLCDRAEAGQVFTSGLVAQIVRPRISEPLQTLGALRLREVPDPVDAFLVQWEPTTSGTPAETEDTRTADPITVVIVDDERLLRSGFRVILETEPDITVVGEAPDGRAALDITRRRRPDVVLMDIRMPVLDGIQAAELILDDPDLETAVLMLTTFDRDQHVYDALRIGASGFLLKDTPADRLLDAIRVAAAGEALLDPSITRRLIEQFTDAARPAPDTIPTAMTELTSRELEVLRLVARGLSNAEIAEQLTLGESTVKTHVAHLLAKLGLRDRVQAVVLAYETRLITPEHTRPT